MARSATGKVFISYARKDGADLAQRLQADLKKHAYDAWIDTQRIAGGASWTREIESALDESEVVLALLTPSSYVSEICRAEQLRSLRKGKCVIPILAQRGSDIPLHLETKNYLDFTQGGSYARQLAKLLKDVGSRKGVTLHEKYRQTYVTAPPLPANFVDRPEALDALRNAVLTDGSNRHIALTALRGMGGLGKTVLAQALCHDPVVQGAFPDGVIWVTVGKESTVDAVTRLREVGKALDDDLSRYDNELGCKNQYRTTICSKAALIVVDDIWNTADIEPLLAESERSRLLFTTRDSSIAAAVGAQEQVAELLTEGQCRSVLARWAGVEENKLPAEAADLIHECGHLPLALSMVGAMLRGKPRGLWQSKLKLLRNADLARIEAQFPGYSHPNLFAAIQVSVDGLKPFERERYCALAVLLEEMSIPRVIQQSLWATDASEAAETTEKFISLSLAQRDGVGGGIRLHDLQLDYIRAQYANQEALDLLHGAVQLSSHVVVKDPAQFASQMVGRLMALDSEPDVQHFIRDLSEYAPRPWLRLLWPALHAPGGALLRTLAGHSDPVVGVAVSGDGKRAVSASWDRTLKVWDVESGRELHTLKGHRDRVLGVAISGDGRCAVSASQDNTLKIWDVESGQEVHTLKGHWGWVFGVAMSEDGRCAVSASHDNMLKIWDVESGQEVQTLKGHSSSVLEVAMSQDGKRAVSASFDQTLKVWDVQNGWELHTLKGHSDSVHGVAVSGEGRRAVSASNDGMLKVWDLESGRELRTLKGHSDSVHGVAVSQDGKRAVSASWDKTLKVWDLESGCELRMLKGHSHAVTGVAVSRDGKRVVSASWDQTLKIWDLESGRELRTHKGHSDSVHGVAVSQDEKCAVSASSDGTLRVWDLESGRALHTLKGHSSVVRGAAIRWDGKRAISASDDFTLKVWDVESGRELHTLKGHSMYVVGVAVSEDWKHAVSASSDQTLKVWDLENGRELRMLKGHSDRVTGVAVSRDGKRAVSASQDNTLKVWDMENGLELHTLQGHRDQVLGVALSRDGRLAVSASRDQTLKVWDVQNGRALRSLKGHTNDVLGVAISGDGRLAVSASRDQTLKVWDLDSSAILATFTCDGTANCCAFAGFDRIIAGNEGGEIYFLVLVL